MVLNLGLSPRDMKPRVGRRLFVMLGAGNACFLRAVRINTQMYRNSHGTEMN